MTSSTVNNIVTSYTYDGNGLRQTKTTNNITTNHIYDGSNIVVDENADEKQVFVRGINLIFRCVNGGTKKFYHFNVHNDVIYLTNSTGIKINLTEAIRTCLKPF